MRGLVKREVGFTMIEVLVAVAIISFGILAFAANNISVTQGRYISSNYTIAVNLAQEKLEELKAQNAPLGACPPASNPSALCGDTNVAGTAYVKINAKGTTDAPGNIFSRTWRIALQSGGVYKIDVTVSWTDYRSRSAVVSTYVTTYASGG